jgi:transposase
VEPSEAEAAVLKRIRRAKLIVFLRTWRHELFDAAFQEELATLYEAAPKGQPPIPPAQLALATLLQAYFGVSDDEAIEALTMDRRWQVVLDCLDCPEAPFSKGTLVAFRQRLIAQDMDRRLIERTIAVARDRGGIGVGRLRLALDSSPLWGAGRVEDTYNLLGHALRKALSVLARQQGRELAPIAAEAGAGIVSASSLKAALDCNWDDPAAGAVALRQVLATLDAVEVYLAAELESLSADERREVQTPMAVAQMVHDQDLTLTEAGTLVLQQGVARDRRISVEDPDMRHGRKSRSQRVDGFKRHVVRELDSRLIPAVGLTPANAPEASVTDDLLADLIRQDRTVAEWQIDRAYLTSSLVRDRTPDVTIVCKAWPVRNGPYFPKTAFTLDWQQQTLRCPNDVELPFQPGRAVHFPADTCAACPKRSRCTSSSSGRSVRLHPEERLFAELRQRQLTPLGRAKLRERVGAEHAPAHIGQWQGHRARYRGHRKNLFDLRRYAVIENLHVLAASPAFAAA